MHQIYVLSCLDSTSNGPVSTYTDQPVHLRQGDLDGACGHYSMMMVLIMLGHFSRDEACTILGYEDDLNPEYGKLLKKIMNKKFFLGTLPSDIKSIVNTAFKGEIVTNPCEGTGVEIRRFVEESLLEDKPVMLGIEFSGGAHWVIAVGLDYDGADDDKNLCRFLVLDSGGLCPTFSAWNGAVTTLSKQGPYPYHWYNEKDSRDVKFIYALSFEKC